MPDLTMLELRDAVTRLIAHGRPGVVVVEVDDHVSDETIAASRRRLVLRSAADVRAVAHALDDALQRDRGRPPAVPPNGRRRK